MVGKKTLESIENQVSKILENKSLYPYHAEYISGSKTLRIYIDSNDGKVSIDACADLSRELSKWLDEKDMISHEYNLEVSSPGMERILSKDWHFTKVVGKTVKIQLYDRLENYVATENALRKAKKITGKLISYNDKELKINIEGADFVLPPKGVAKANLVFDSF